MKILMVCLGNICRSPLAEGILQHKAEELGLDWEIDSAGTEYDHVGEAPHRLSQKIARENGLDISHQRARRFRPEDLDQYDKIYVMARNVFKELEWIAGKNGQLEKVDYFLNELYPGENRSVPDPWYGGQADFEKAYDMIEKCCETIIRKYAVEKQQK